MKFCVMFGHNPVTNRLDLSDKVKVNRGQKVKIVFLQITAFNIVVVATKKLEFSLLNILYIILNMTVVGLTVSKIEVKGQRGQVTMK